MGRHSAEEITAVIRPQRRNAENVTEDDEYLAMVWRMVRALEYRAIENPVLLPQLKMLQQRLGEAIDVAIAVNADRYAIDPRRGASMAECGRALKITKQSASERRARGLDAISARIDGAGAVRFSEARRERDMVKITERAAVVDMTDWITRRQAV